MLNREKEEFRTQMLANVYYLFQRLCKAYDNRSDEQSRQRESTEHVRQLLLDKIVAESEEFNPFYPLQLQSAEPQQSLTALIDTAHDVVHDFLPRHCLDHVDKFFDFDNPIYDEMLAFVAAKKLQFDISDLEFLVLGISSNRCLDQHSLQHYKYLGMYMGVLLELLQKQAGFDLQQGEDVIQIDLYEGYFPYLFFGARNLSKLSGLNVTNAHGDYIFSRIASPDGYIPILCASNIRGNHCMSYVAYHGGEIGLVLAADIHGDHTLSGAASYGGNIHTLFIGDCIGDELLEYAGDFGGRIEHHFFKNIYKKDGTPYEPPENDPVVVQNMKVLEKN